MPRGKYVNHKGRNRHFTSPEELEAQRKDEEQQKKWRETREKNDEDEEDEASEQGSDSSEEESETEKPKGASAVIQIRNPNRQVKKSHLKAGEVTEENAPQLSRRERKQLELQKEYRIRHAAGNTTQAKADLARLAIIKQHRAEAAARREAEKKAKDNKGGAE